MAQQKETRPGFAVGARIVLDAWGADPPGDVWPEAIAPGTEGTITSIDHAGTLHAEWDDGSRLGVIPGVDVYRLAVVTPEEVAEAIESIRRVL